MDDVHTADNEAGSQQDPASFVKESSPMHHGATMHHDDTGEDGSEPTETTAEQQQQQQHSRGKRKKVECYYKDKTKKKPKRQGIVHPPVSEEVVHIYVENGFRRIRPYYFTHQTYVKGRWLGVKILDMFTKEFQSETKEYYEKAIREARILVNNKPVTPDYVLSQNDVIKNTMHRHEPPISTQPIKIVYEDDDVVVIDKPSSIPVHPSGRYRHLTAINLLGHDHNLWKLHTCHRLDRHTSGLLIFAKNIATSRRVDELIRGREVSKEYVCLVPGKFPKESVKCTVPIKQVAWKIGMCIASNDGKPAETVFELLQHFPADEENEERSVVLCKPRTGRMHQIRVHLQYLGFPILDDPFYRKADWPNAGKGGLDEADADKIVQSVFETIRKEMTDITSFPVNSAVGQTVNSEYYDPYCTECQIVRPDPAQLGIFLHALRYSGPGWSYETELPTWAQHDVSSKAESDTSHTSISIDHPC